MNVKKKNDDFVHKKNAPLRGCQYYTELGIFRKIQKNHFYHKTTKDITKSEKPGLAFSHATRSLSNIRLTYYKMCWIWPNLPIIFVQ